MKSSDLGRSFQQRLNSAAERVTTALLEEAEPGGFWAGELSSSALSTATALIALSTLRRRAGEVGDEDRIRAGLIWLKAHQNRDGGWGDTVRSRSNISTSALVWAAYGACQAEADADFVESAAAVEAWLKRACGASDQNQEWCGSLAEAIRARYGKDRTFSVPILMACVLSGRLGSKGWSEVPALPFELAALPHRFFGALRLPVVSYALPALIAIGQVIHHHAPSRNMAVRLLRDCLRERTLKVLATLQPRNGGFLEATPLTSFVLMALAGIGEGRGEVAVLAASFLRKSVRPDGSWPIDTNLATWLTTWSIQALRWQGGVGSYERRRLLREWLLQQQYRVEHPYTHAAPGGWAWTDLPGGVPDADDTPGALLAILELGPVDAEVRLAGELGTRWLLGLQNSDGGIPTFCRGWGALPFDRSSADLTAHALRAWSAWLPQWTGELRGRVENAIGRAVDFLSRTQDEQGGWMPLWFGNERSAGEVNPTYGTARVIMALRELRARGFDLPEEMLQRAEARLVELQLSDGGWGGGSEEGMESSIEETGVAVEALAGSKHVGVVLRGTEWLLERVENGGWREPAPIGFYFAKLWYFERLYPVILTVGALGAVRRMETEMT